MQFFREDMTLNDRKMKTKLTQRSIYKTAVGITAKRRKRTAVDPIMEVNHMYKKRFIMKEKG
jgi:hypothetical protein